MCACFFCLIKWDWACQQSGPGSGPGSGAEQTLVLAILHTWRTCNRIAPQRHLWYSLSRTLTLAWLHSATSGIVDKNSIVFYMGSRPDLRLWTWTALPWGRSVSCIGRGSCGTYALRGTLRSLYREGFLWNLCLEDKCWRLCLYREEILEGSMPGGEYWETCIGRGSCETYALRVNAEDCLHKVVICITEEWIETWTVIYTVNWLER